MSDNCSRDPAGAFAVFGAATLRAKGQPVALDLRSCDGADVRDVVNTQATTIVPASADAISVTMGGNDFGFSQVLVGCLSRGCRSLDQDTDQFPGFTHEPGRSDWDVLQQRIADALITLRPKLAPRGQVYLLTYPIPFPAQPDATCIQTTAPLNQINRDLANAATDRLDTTIIAAATAANARAGTPFVTTVEWRTGLDIAPRVVTDQAGVVRRVRDNPNGICSPEPMVNGIVTTSELRDSFHPTDRGLRFAGDAVAKAISVHNQAG